MRSTRSSARRADPSLSDRPCDRSRRLLLVLLPHARQCAQPQRRTGSIRRLHHRCCDLIGSTGAEDCARGFPVRWPRVPGNSNAGGRRWRQSEAAQGDGRPFRGNPSSITCWGPSICGHLQIVSARPANNCRARPAVQTLFERCSGAAHGKKEIAFLAFPEMIKCHGVSIARNWYSEEDRR